MEAGRFVTNELVQLVSGVERSMSEIISDYCIENEIPAGLINGENKIFTSEFDFMPGKTKLFLRGIRRALGVEYTETGLNQITFGIAPQPGDSLIIDYLRS